MTFINMYHNLSPLSVSIRSGFEFGGTGAGPTSLSSFPFLHHHQGCIGEALSSVSSNPCKGPVTAPADKWGLLETSGGPLDTKTSDNSMVHLWFPPPRA